jgi:hypothetical protein
MTGRQRAPGERQRRMPGCALLVIRGNGQLHRRNNGTRGRTLATPRSANRVATTGSSVDAGRNRRRPSCEVESPRRRDQQIVAQAQSAPHWSRGSGDEPGRRSVTMLREASAKPLSF